MIILWCTKNIICKSAFIWNNVKTGWDLHFSNLGWWCLVTTTKKRWKSTRIVWKPQIFYLNDRFLTSKRSGIVILWFISDIMVYFFFFFLWDRDLSAISQRRSVRREGKQSQHKRQHYSPADLRYILLWMEYWKTQHRGQDYFSSLITEPFVPEVHGVWWDSLQMSRGRGALSWC